MLPNLAAGCSMADMADLDSVEECWEQLEEIFGTAPGCEWAGAGDPGDVHELVGGAEGILRAAWRHCVHVVQCEVGAGVGV